MAASRRGFGKRLGARSRETPEGAGEDLLITSTKGTAFLCFPPVSIIFPPHRTVHVEARLSPGA